MHRSHMFTSNFSHLKRARENRENRDRPHFCTYYSYDQENRLTRIDYPDSDYSTYKYDALGRRIEKRDTDGAISRYVYDGYNMVAEYDGNNNKVASYVQDLGVDSPISMYRGAEMYWYHKDALGSVYQLTDSDENIDQSYDYSAFGKINTETGALINPFTYTAREYEQDSGLYYYRARYYDASIGRFLGRDPLFERALQERFYSRLDQVLNSYSYVKNNPINLIDPSGEKYEQPCPCGKVCKMHWAYYTACSFGELSWVDAALVTACATVTGWVGVLACILVIVGANIHFAKCSLEARWCE